MIVPQDRYAEIAKNFDTTLSKVAKTLDASNLQWFVVASWALDLFTGRKMREHEDIEVSIWRDESSLLFEVFKNHRIDMVVGHKRYQALIADSELDHRGHLIIRDLEGVVNAHDIEIFLSERSKAYWIFRKDQSVTAKLEDAVLVSSDGIKYLAPQYVLLFKAWFFPNMLQALKESPAEADYLEKCWQTDCADFESTLPAMSSTQRRVLESLLQTQRLRITRLAKATRYWSH